MQKRCWHGGFWSCVFVPYLGLSLFGHTFALGQAHGNATGLSVESREGENAEVRGCLSGTEGKFYLEPLDGSQSYELTGKTSLVAAYINKEVTVQGRLDTSTKPPHLEVEAAKVVFDTPVPELSSAFRKISSWHTKTSQRYGVRVAQPDLKGNDEEAEIIGRLEVSPAIPETLEPYFVADERAVAAVGIDRNVVAAASFYLPKKTYLNTNFMGGSFAVLVNRRIHDETTCAKFTSGEPPTYYAFGKTRYASTTSTGAAMGTYSTEYYFHTFQNGLCYELAFQFFTHSTANGPEPWCTFTMVDEGDLLAVIRPVMEHVSFFKPLQEH